MTDQRTLKIIIGEQRGTIEKQKLIIDELNENYLKLNAKFEAEQAKIEAAKQVVEDDENWNYHEPQVRQKLRDCLSQENITEKKQDAP